MATVYKILGQALGTTSLASLYSVPASTSAVVSTISVANLTANDVTYRINVKKAGEADNDKQFLVYDATVLAKSTATYTLGITLGAQDQLRVLCSTANAVAFQAFGSEMS